MNGLKQSGEEGEEYPLIIELFLLCDSSSTQFSLALFLAEVIFSFILFFTVNIAYLNSSLKDTYIDRTMEPSLVFSEVAVLVHSDLGGWPSLTEECFLRGFCA